MTPRPDDHVLVDTNVLLSASDSGRPTHAAAVEASDAGRLVWAAPFVPTVPGTDAYTDQLR